MSAKAAPPKACFVIAPIGDEGSDTRLRSDQILRHIIEPVAAELGYSVTRADKICEPGVITSQVITHLLDDDLVVADLTDHNPNVFYELAVRHAVRKPIVQLIEDGQKIPFDVAANRTIQVDHHDLDSVQRAREQLKLQIENAAAKPEDVDSPISSAVDLKAFKQSEDPATKSNAEVLMMIQQLKVEVSQLAAGTRGQPASTASRNPKALREVEMRIEDASVQLQRIERLALDMGPEGADGDRVHEVLEVIRHEIRRVAMILEPASHLIREYGLR